MSSRTGSTGRSPRRRASLRQEAEERLERGAADGTFAGAVLSSLVAGCEQPLRNLALEARKPTNRFIALSWHNA